MDDKKNILLLFKNGIMNKTIRFLLISMALLLAIKVGLVLIYNGDTWLYVENSIPTNDSYKNVKLFIDDIEVHNTVLFPDSLQLEKVSQLLWIGNHKITCDINGDLHDYHFTVLFNSYITLVVTDTSVIYDHSYFTPLKM
jgi:hypothetical protein